MQVSQGGRRAQVADSDWRTMLAIQSFEQQYGDRPEYPAWLQAEKPLSQLPSLQRILDLANLKIVAGSASSGQPQPTQPTPQPPVTKHGDNAPEDSPTAIPALEGTSIN